MDVPMTRSGYEQLQKELDRLRKKERPKVIADIAEARSHGDLSENAEYSAAKERQSFVEGKIEELKSKIAYAQVIDPSKQSSETIVFGATVEIMDLERDEKKTYMLVGQEESDLGNGKISVQSPVGRALIGKRVGDLVEVKSPARQIEYEVLSIRFI